LVRHLVLPGDLANTETMLAFLAWEISADTWLNLMDQYHPCYSAPIQVVEFPLLG
jgi:putative pyruvate formate lyase activating enzyme